VSLHLATAAQAADLGWWLMPAAAAAGAVTVRLIREHRQRRSRGRRHDR
jgi:hypothetical protein